MKKVELFKSKHGPYFKTEEACKEYDEMMEVRNDEIQHELGKYLKRLWADDEEMDEYIQYFEKLTPYQCEAFQSFCEGVSQWNKMYVSNANWDDDNSPYWIDFYTGEATVFNYKRVQEIKKFMVDNCLGFMGKGSEDSEPSNDQEKD